MCTRHCEIFQKLLGGVSLPFSLFFIQCCFFCFFFFNSIVALSVPWMLSCSNEKLKPMS